MRSLFVLAVWFLCGGLSANVGQAQSTGNGQDAPLAPEIRQDAPLAPEIRQTGPHNAVIIRAVGSPGRWSGFDVLADEQVVAPVRFTSHELVFSPQAVAATNGLTSTLTFDALQTAPDCGVTLAHSRVIVSLTAQQYPVVSFDLRLTAFDVRLWQQAVGVQPFHFLTLAMPDATVWHQDGWLYPTPRADLFPLLLDPACPLNACTDNREWSRTPALDAHALPVIGLWSPARRVYAGWDFQEARLSAASLQNLSGQHNAPNAAGTENVGTNAGTETADAEHNIGLGYCNRLVVATDPFLMQTIETAPPSHVIADTNTPRSKNGQPPRRDPRARKLLNPVEQASREYDTRGVSKFVALVAPPQIGPALAQPAYPVRGAHLASRATLLFHTDLGGMDDPNRFCWERWWNTPALQSRLARVPRVNDLGWIPDALHLRDLPSPSPARLLTSAPGDAFLSGTLRLSAIPRHNESGIDAPAISHDTISSSLAADTRLLLAYAHRFTLDKEPCVYWAQPLAGEWTPTQGGEPAATLHNPNGWTAGRLLLDQWKKGKEGKRERGKEEIRDAHTIAQSESTTNDRVSPVVNSPSSLSLLPSPPPSLIDGVFNWTKHAVWTRGGREDAPALPTMRDGAAAIAFLLDYYFTFRDDMADGEHRARALQALEMARSFAYRYLPMRAGGQTGAGGEVTPADRAVALDTLAQVAVHTGDPILLWALQGSVYGESLRHAATGQEQFSRSLSLLNRTEQTGRTGAQWLAADAQATPDMPPRDESAPEAAYSLLDPVGDTNARVICGDKAAVCFNRGERDIVVTNYRRGRAGEFAFTARRLGARGLRPIKGEAINLTVTFPGVDLSHSAVAVRHGNLTQRTLTAEEIMRTAGASWSFVVRNLRDGDTLVVGTPDLNAAEVLPSTPPLVE